MLGGQLTAADTMNSNATGGSCAKGGTDEEDATLKTNCDHFRGFLKLLAERGNEDLSSESQMVVEEIEREMAAYLEKKIKKSAEKEMNKNLERKVHNDGDKPVIKKEVRKMESASNEESEPQSDSSDSVLSTFKSTGNTSEEEKPQKVKRKKQKPTVDAKTESQLLATLLQRLDNRSIPKQEPFKEETGQDFQQYLERFEDYCRDNFRGKKYLWIPELERHLTGRILEGFQSLRDYDDNYDEMKSKLVNWYKDSKYQRRTKAKNKFENAKLKPKESLFLFATRLESLFKTAFPTHRVQESRTLRNQFLENIPKNVKQEINAQILTYKIKDKKITWAFMLKCARLKDADREHQKKQDTEDEENPEEIIVHLGNTSRIQPVYSSEGHTHYRQQRNSRSKHSPIASGSHQQRPYMARSAGFRTPPDAYWCNICKRFGHTIENCRRRLKACFHCGSKDHFIRECQQRYQGRSRFQQNGRRFSSGNYQSQERRANKWDYQRRKFHSTSPRKQQWKGKEYKPIPRQEHLKEGTQQRGREDDGCQQKNSTLNR